MPVKKLKDFLESEKVNYVCTTHSPAFTSQEVAAAAHVSGKDMAKTVMVKINGSLAMVVVPANCQVHFGKLKEVVGAVVDLASESEFKEKFAGCEVGAMPPFGNLYDMPVYISEELGKQDHIIFNSGSHAELMELDYKDYARLVKPSVVDL